MRYRRASPRMLVGLSYGACVIPVIFVFGPVWTRPRGGCNSRTTYSVTSPVSAATWRTLQVSSLGMWKRSSEGKYPYRVPESHHPFAVYLTVVYNHCRMECGCLLLRIASVIPYYPFKGIDRFYDIGGLLLHPELFQTTVDILTERYVS